VTEVLPAGADAGSLDTAASALAAGLVVAFPTDTVYALGVDPTVAGASERLFTLKRRPRDIDLPVIVGTIEQALGLVTALPVAARRLMECFWPGPLTLVLPRSPELGADLGDDDLTIGVRMPDHPVPLGLCRRAGPIGVASAGPPEGEGEFTTAEDVTAAFGDGLAVVLDGGRCEQPPATVVDATGEEPHLIREGRLPWSDVVEALSA
jgi:L-threonylcarbamoyladenylate synthase